MNQQRQIELLDSILPDIVATGDPEGVMLKVARQKGLAPAQLERLGQMYNVSKTLVGLEKQASRGGSFSIVDVPALVKRYITYTPESGKGSTSMKKEASAGGSNSDWFSFFASPQDGTATAERLPSFSEVWMGRNAGNGVLNVEVEGNKSAEALFNEAFPKEAGAEHVLTEEEEEKQASCRLKAYNLLRQIIYEHGQDMHKEAEAIRYALMPDYDGSKWAELADDARIAFGKKAGAALRYIQDKFADFGLRIPEPPALTKEAGSHALARDRYNLLDSVQDIMWHLDELDKCASKLDSVKDKDDAERKKKGKGSRMEGSGKKSPGIVSTLVDAANPVTHAKNINETAKGMVDFVSSMTEDPEERKKLISDAEEAADWRAAMDDIRLSDPIIGRADANQVEEIMQTLRVLAPALSKHPKALKPIVAASIEAGGTIPVPMMMSVSGIEKNLADTALRNQDLKSRG